MTTFLLINTYHPFDAIKTAHLTSGVYWCHAVFGADIKWTAGLQDEELEDVQVALLGGQVNGRHVVVHLGIGAEREKNTKFALNLSKMQV